MTGATSIVTYILQYNGGVMPETQAQLDTVLAKIPEDTQKSYLSDPMCGIIRFSTVKHFDNPAEQPERAG